jgi:RNA polymerase sigma-70 factor (ECF subfamily)
MLNHSDLSDGELSVLIRQGNHDAFAELVRRHTQCFFALAFRTLQNKSDAEDVVQSCFLKFWQRPHLWQEGKSKFTTWFYRVVINACYDLQRQKPNHNDVSVDTFESLMPRSASEETIASDKQNHIVRQRQVEIAMSKLLKTQRDAINLVVYCELPQRQAAEVLGISVKALESLLIRAKRNLTKTVQEHLLTETETAREVSHGARV